MLCKIKVRLKEIGTVYSLKSPFLSPCNTKLERVLSSSPNWSRGGDSGPGFRGNDQRHCLNARPRPEGRPKCGQKFSQNVSAEVW